MKQWISDNPGWAYVIGGAVLGFVYIFFSSRWPTQTLIVTGIAALPHVFNLFLGGFEKNLMPDWLIIGTALILAAFACGSIITAIGMAA